MPGGFLRSAHIRSLFLVGNDENREKQQPVLQWSMKADTICRVAKRILDTISSDLSCGTGFSVGIKTMTAGKDGRSTKFS